MNTTTVTPTCFLTAADLARDTIRVGARRFYVYHGTPERRVTELKATGYMYRSIAKTEGPHPLSREYAELPVIEICRTDVLTRWDAAQAEKLAAEEAAWNARYGTHPKPVIEELDDEDDRL